MRKFLNTLYVLNKDTYLSLETIFEQNIRLCLLDARKEYIEQGANPETMTAFSEKALRDFCSFFQ